jgi:hypothetical protein
LVKGNSDESGMIHESTHHVVKKAALIRLGRLGVEGLMGTESSEAWEGDAQPQTQSVSPHSNQIDWAGKSIHLEIECGLSGLPRVVRGPSFVAGGG